MRSKRRLMCVLPLGDTGPHFRALTRASQETQVVVEREAVPSQNYSSHL